MIVFSLQLYLRVKKCSAKQLAYRQPQPQSRNLNQHKHPRVPSIEFFSLALKVVIVTKSVGVLVKKKNSDGENAAFDLNVCTWENSI